MMLMVHYQQIWLHTARIVARCVGLAEYPYKDTRPPASRLTLRTSLTSVAGKCEAARGVPPNTVDYPVNPGKLTQTDVAFPAPG